MAKTKNKRDERDQHDEAGVKDSGAKVGQVP
jgi:hypothetical protein